MSIYSRIIDIQKLEQAWQKVKRNKPACGVDHITYEEFDANQKLEIKQLNLELVEHRYQVAPVKMVTLVKEEKLREISLYTMRDKVVQTSIANELMRMYDNSFSSSTYAYRNKMSALQAIQRIEDSIRENRYFYALKTDITSFFDNINQERLRQLLQQRIKEEDVIALIMEQLRAPSVTRDGELIEKQRGIYQGSAISPILSNVYMDAFDREMSREAIVYVRYSDDMLILAESKLVLEQIIVKIKGLLENLSLSIKPERTYIRAIKEGFDFLGYHFDNSGKAIPAKAQEKLEVSLEDTWLLNANLTIEERLKKGSQILNGWEQYYREEREIHDIYEYVVVMYMVRYKSELEAIRHRRSSYRNEYKDIAIYLCQVWKENGWKELQLLEYQQYFHIADSAVTLSDDTYMQELLAIYEALMIMEDEDHLTALMQTYSDLGWLEQAEQVMERIQKLQDTGITISIPHAETESNDELVKATKATADLFATFLIGREDMYTREMLTSEGRRKCEFVPEPLTTEVLLSHLNGTETIGTYLVRNNDTVHYVVLDIDISRKVLLSNTEETIQNQYLQLAATTALKIKKMIGGFGLKSYLEFSGHRGYHIWIFFTEWIPIRYAYSLLDMVVAGTKTELSEDISLECFPTHGKRKVGTAGQSIKLPYGFHLISGQRSFFCNDNLEAITNINEELSGLAKYSVTDVKRVIAANMSTINKLDGEEGVDADSVVGLHHGASEVDRQKRRPVIGIDYEQLGDLNDSVAQILRGCSLMQYLVHKAMTTGYLTHYERLSILNVFGHAGEEGKEFVHTVMSYTLNYQHYITQKFISRLPQKPISCIKLREQYKQITAEYGCSCVFKRTKNCYPSPVLHALKKSSEDVPDVTIPISKTLTKEKEQMIYQELNIHVKVQELAGKIVELKKQKKGIDKTIAKVERELMQIYDNAGVDCMDVEMGTLVRRKRDQEYEWLIEI